MLAGQPLDHAARSLTDAMRAPQTTGHTSLLCPSSASMPDQCSAYGAPHVAVHRQALLFSHRLSLSLYIRVTAQRKKTSASAWLSVYDGSELAREDSEAAF